MIRSVLLAFTLY